MSSLPRPPTKDFPWPSIPIDPTQLSALVRRCKAQRVGYALGAKVPTLRALPGTFRAIDCSGFVRWAIYQSTAGTFQFPDGSQVQHEYCRSQGFKQSTVAAGKLSDGHVRIAFLEPHGGEPGHVVLLYGGRTYESHGGVGPDSRVWDGTGWQAETTVYVLQ